MHASITMVLSTPCLRSTSRTIDPHLHNLACRSPTSRNPCRFDAFLVKTSYCHIYLLVFSSLASNQLLSFVLKLSKTISIILVYHIYCLMNFMFHKILKYFRTMRTKVSTLGVKTMHGALRVALIRLETSVYNSISWHYEKVSAFRVKTMGHSKQRWSDQKTSRVYSIPCKTKFSSSINSLTYANL